MGIESLLQFLPLLLKTAPAAKAGMQGINLDAQRETANELKQITRAQTNMNNPLFQSLLKQNKQQGQTDLAATIAQLQAQNRLAQSNGQKPLLDQERGGESIFRNLMRGQEEVSNQSVNQTFGQLENAQTGLQNLYGTQGNLSNADFQNKVKKVGAYGSIGDALQGIFSLKKPQQNTSSYSNPMDYLNPQKPLSLLPVSGAYQSTGGY